MSAYGAITRAGAPAVHLPPLAFPLTSDPTQLLAIHHVTLAETPQELLQLLHAGFNDELERGRTYPQEGPMDLAAFSAYYFAADVFIGVLVAKSGNATAQTLDAARGGRSWEESVAGCYYASNKAKRVKPNYPGRSSHVCNAGFFVLPVSRGKGCGSLLGQSYLVNAPLLGYKASVFNLVYTNNVASVRIWEGLGFEKVGKIPRVGRLKKADESGEEYVDAWVIWKEFEAPAAK
ncbi:hypothetical protein AURDEDRAFT_70185 [Auricularia subglabra TFB-10046 SS5]|nr:hypothetical protein AURDEDRAFT_70185 [Auricularia subglabra TFB-10046 SS5]